MIGNPINYDKKQTDKLPNTQAKITPELRRYMKLIEGKEALDLGIGQGQNAIFLSNSGYQVTGIDFSKKALEIARENCPNLNLVQDDIRNFNIGKDKYDLILSSNVLHFLNKDDSYEIIENIKSNLKTNGLVYISVFSIDDPSLDFRKNNPDFCELENNVFHKKSDDTYMSYFSKDEILNLFSDFTTIFISDEYSLDLGHGKPHYHGMIKYVGKKGNT